MKTFGHNDLDAIIDNWEKMTSTLLNEMLRGKHFVFQGENANYNGRVFTVNSVTHTMMGTEVNYSYESRYTYQGYTPLRTDIKNFIKQIKQGSRIPFDEEWK